jgi:hypothetical protein
MPAAAIQNTPVAAVLQTNEVVTGHLFAAIDHFKRRQRGLTLESARQARPRDESRTPEANSVARLPSAMTAVFWKSAAEVQRDDNGDWRWIRTTTLAEHGLPSGSGRATSRRDAQKKALPKPT